MDIPLDWLVALTFVVSLTSSIVSGIGGGGAGFIMTPYYILIGLTPQQAIATGKMGALGIAAGSTVAFRGKGLVDKKYIWWFLLITGLCAVVSSWLLPKIDPALFQSIIGWALIIMTPTLFINKGAFKPGPRSRGWIVAGFIAFAIVSFFQTMMATGIATLIVVVLMILFGLDALKANATKRVAQMSQAIIMFVLLFVQGLVMIGHGIAALLGTAIGGYIGSRIAINKGAGFVRIVLAITMVVSGILLLVT